MGALEAGLLGEAPGSYVDPFDRELIISCGAALLNLRVALAYFRVPVEITTFPQSSDPDVVARVVFPASGLMLRAKARPAKGSRAPIPRVLPPRPVPRSKVAAEGMPAK
jgi:hypothetical protein